MVDDEAPAARPQVMPVFMGAPWAQRFGGKGSELSLQEWKSQTEYLAGLQGLSEHQRLQFVLGSLEGEAKREVQAAPEDRRNNSNAVFDFLAGLYGDHTPVATLRAQFFTCRQGPRQSLRSFVLQMRELFTRLQGRRDHGLGGGDTLLRDQFLMGLCNTNIRQSLRLQLRHDPNLTFEDLRREATALELDHSETADQPTCLATSTACAPAPPSTADWKREVRAEVMKEVKEQMAELSKTFLEELRRGQSSHQPGNPPLPRERSYSDGSREPPRRPGRATGPRFQWDDQGRPVCNSCGESGHISRQCGPGPRRGSQGDF